MQGQTLSTNKHTLTLLGSLAAAITLCACAPAVPVRALGRPAAKIIEDGSALGAGDVFEVKVFGEENLNGKYRIDAEGTINFPMVGILRVAGLSPPQIAMHIENKLRAGYLRTPQVSIFVQEQVSKKIHVLGQVAKPGTFQYAPGMNLVEAITQAGGFTPLSAKNGTKVTRIEDGKHIIYPIRAGDVTDGTAENFYLRPGDIITVPERFF